MSWNNNYNNTMKKLLLLFTTLSLISCSSTIEADAKKYCELMNRLISLDTIFNDLNIGVNDVRFDELVNPIYYESTWTLGERDELLDLFKSYKGGIFEFTHYETNEPILINTDSLSNYEFINHPSFITTVANKYKKKEDGGFLEKIETKIVEYKLKEDLIIKERNTILSKYKIEGDVYRENHLNDNYSEEFISLTANCY